MKKRRQGLTLIEILVVLGIIALLTGLLIPALTVVKNTAKEAKQKAQFSAIDIALMTFKNDYGDYPPSEMDDMGNYCGAQKLCEALMGWDLLGFHPKSEFNASGGDDNWVMIYDANNIDQRKGPYLEGENANAFRLGNYPAENKYGLFADTTPLAPYTYVLCDVFGMTKVRLSNGTVVTAGAPILYYQANTSGRTLREIYRVADNDAVVQIKEVADGAELNQHPLGIADNDYQYFYDYISDPKIEAKAWPYRPDSYILISAGADGLYGTGDDIRNFGN